MTAGDRLVIRGRVHISLRGVARCFDVRIEFVEQVYAEGMLGVGEKTTTEVYISARHLDRFARIVRWHSQSGLALESIAALIGTDDR